MLLPSPSIMLRLKNYQNELARLKTGSSPFGLTCFNQSAAQRLDPLLDPIANNDEYHRAKNLRYANKKKRQVALEKLKHFPDENKNKEAHDIIKKLSADQGLQAASAYQRLSQPLHTGGLIKAIL